MFCVNFHMQNPLENGSFPKKPLIKNFSRLCIVYIWYLFYYIIMPRCAHACTQRRKVVCLCLCITSLAAQYECDQEPARGSIDRLLTVLFTFVHGFAKYSFLLELFLDQLMENTAHGSLLFHSV